jgi:Holliday junction resolvase-like predicted endonuclease
VTCWTADDLLAELRRYEQVCTANGCAQATIDSYVGYAQMFLDWRVGQSHTRGADGPHRPRADCATVDELTADVNAYGTEVGGAGLQPRAAQTYTVHASQFIRWLAGDFEPCLGRRRGNGSGRSVRTVGRSPATPPDLSWAREEGVQAAVVAWLEAAGWATERVADTAAREHGEDIVARLGSRRLAVEVKGYPQAAYERGEKAGTPKKWHPAGQARTYFATAVHTALVMRDAQPGTEVAIALPDVPGYRGLLRQVEASLAELAVRVFVVGPAGSVRELATKPT